MSFDGGSEGGEKSAEPIKLSDLPSTILPGLELLEQIDSAFIETWTDAADGYQGVPADRGYFVYSSEGQRVFFAAEISKVFYRCCFGQAHPFEMNLVDYTGTTVINLKRSMTFPLFMWGGDLCGDRLTVTHFNGEILGTVVQKRGIRPKYNILDSAGKIILILIGPDRCGYCTLCRDVEFKIYLPQNLKHEIGYITNNWEGILETTEKSESKYGVCFPMDLDAEVKAILLGAAFLINYMFFEDMRSKFSGLICLLLICTILIIVGIVCALFYIPNRP